MAKITQISTYNGETKSWSTPMDIGAKASNVDYEESNVATVLGTMSETLNEVKEVTDAVADHPETSISQEEGVHGLRFYNAELQRYDVEEDAWITISSGGSDIAIGDVSGAALSITGTTATLTWSDPPDVEVGSVVLARWAGTVVVRKIGSAPASVSDGTTIVTNTVRNQYSTNGFQDSGLSYGVTYYYGFFPYKMIGNARSYTIGSSVSGSPVRTKINTVPSPKSSIIYNGQIKFPPEWNDYDENQLDISGDLSGTDVGTYTVTFTPKEGYEWSNGSTSGVSVNWYIVAASVPVPTVTIPSLTYIRGTSQGPTINTEIDESIVSVTGRTAENAGSYTLEFALIDPSSYAWEDGTTTAKTHPWTISPKAVDIPTLNVTSFTYNTQQRTVTPSAYDSNEIEQSGNTTGTGAATYIVYFDLTNTTNYKWSDGTITRKSRTWVINPKSVDVPTLQDKTYTYNTASQNVALNTYSTTEVSVTGDTSGTNAGTYTLKFNLTNTTNYKWSTGSASGERALNWKIEQANGAVTLSKSSVSLTASKPSDTVTVSGATGSVSVSSNSQATATAGISGTTITIIGQASGTATITVNVAESTNYKATSKTISVDVSFLTLVTWADGTDDQIKAMLDAHYAGTIDVKDTWTVGDIRTADNSNKSKFKIASHATGVRTYDGNAWQANGITTEEQSTCKWVILDFNHDTLVTSQGTRTTAAVTIQMLGFLSKEANGTTWIAISMNDTNINNTGWTNCVMRSYCNGAFKNAVGFSGWIKPVKKTTAATGNTSSPTWNSDNDSCFLLSEWEVFGAKTYSAEDGQSAHGGTQYEYYKTSANRVKKRGWESSGSANGWWLRSPYASNATSFCRVNANGNADANGASNNRGVSVAACL